MKPLLPIILAVFVATFVGCLDTYSVAELKVEKEQHLGSISENESEIKQLKIEERELEVKAEEALKAKKGIGKILAEKRVVQDEIEDFEQLLRNEMSVIEACQDSFRIKIKIKLGEKFEVIKLKGGKALKGATFKGFLNGRELKFSHSGGVGVFPISEMPEMIAKHLVLPPVKPMSEVDPALIFSRKPDSLKSRGQLEKERENGRAANARDRDLAYKKEQEEYDQRNEKLKSEREAERNKLKLRQAKLSEFREKIREHKSVYAAHVQAYSDQKLEWQRMKIAPAQADRQKIINSYTSKGRKMAKKISILESEYNALWKAK